MPKFLQGIFTRTANPATSGSIPVNQFEGITADGRVVMRDRRGTRQARVPTATEKSTTLSNALAIYRPDGGKTVDAAKAMANFTGWSFASVNAIASEVANIDLRLYKATGKDHTELDEHPLLDLLDHPNEHATGIELKYTTMAHLELAGNAYWFLDGVSSQTGMPRAIYPLNPGAVRVKVTNSFPKKLSHYEYTEDTKIYTFQPWQILHIKYPDPNDPFVGIGIPQTIPIWIDADNYAMEYNRKFFVNGAGIGLYLATQTNVEGQIERIKQGFKTEHSGVENAHKVPVLPKGVDLKQTGMTHRDMDFGNLSDTTRDRILAGFRVSKTILGTAESDTNRATAETADYVFAKRTIKPKMQLVCSYLNAFLVPRYGEDLYLTFIDPTPEDKAARMDEMSKAVAGMPVMTQNEVRENYMGLGPIDGGDQLLAPNTMGPAGQTDKPEGGDVAPEAAKEGPTKHYSRVKTAEGWQTRAFRVPRTKQQPASVVRRALMESFQKQLDRTPEFQVKSITDLSHDEYMEHWKRFDARSQQAEQEMRRIFHVINGEQKREVIANLEDVFTPEKINGLPVFKAIGDLFDLKEQIGITIDLAAPILTLLARDEATAAFAMIGAKHRAILADEQTREALDRGINKMARSYNETTLQQLKDVLAEKMNQPSGTNLQELKDAVEGVYSFADERRAGLIAKTESYRAANWANREAWQQSGVVKTLIWYTAEDDRVCQFCSELDGTEIGIEDKFFTDDYSTGEVPPRHPDCRCYCRPGEVTLED